MPFRLLIVFLFILAGLLFIFQDDFKNLYIDSVVHLPSKSECQSNDTSADNCLTTDSPSNFLKATSKFNGEFKTVSPSAVKPVVKNVSTPPPIRAIEEVSEVQARRLNLTSLGIIVWTNTERIIANLSQLQENEKLNQAALAKAQDIIKNQYFAHDSPSGAGPAELAKQVGYDYLEIGENLAMGNFENDKAVVDAWMNSLGHRANILNSKYKEIGVAVLKGLYQWKEVWVAVQEFGRPVSDCPPVDENLKSAIDSGKSEIEQLSAILNAKKYELENTSQFDFSFNQKVEEYNKLVEQYNLLVARLKEMIANYNNQALLFSQCL
jgi:uncharacterized protein YkwD